MACPGNYRAQDNIDLFTAFSTITPCKDGRYCCGNGTLANECCGHNLRDFVVNETATNIKPSTISQEAHTIPAVLSTSSELVLATSSLNPSTATASPFSTDQHSLRTRFRKIELFISCRLNSRLCHWYWSCCNPYNLSSFIIKSKKIEKSNQIRISANRASRHTRTRC